MKGKGFWKFNKSLLNDPEYVQKTKNVIEDVKLKYLKEITLAKK
jgi:hypothetical protein